MRAFLTLVRAGFGAAPLSPEQIEILAKIKFPCC